MSLAADMGKPIGVVAAILSIVQGLIWVILAILGLLVYSCSIDTSVAIIGDTITEADIFIQTLLHLYFLDNNCEYRVPGFDGVIPNIMTPADVQIWVIVNLALNVIWIAASIYYLVELFKSDGKGFGVFGWLGTTCLVMILDLAAAFTFGFDYATILGVFLELDTVVFSSTAFLLAPMFLVTLAMRGFILWLVNDGFVTFIIYSLIQQRKDEKESRSRDLSRQASFVNPTMSALYPDETDMSSTYHRSQPPSAWEPMSPNEHSVYPYSSQTPTPRPMSTAGYTTPSQRPPSGYYEQSQRPPGMYNQDQPQRPPGAYTYTTQDQPPQGPLVLADPPKGRSQPSGKYVPPPKHIPSPDYSPPMTPKEMLPIRPVLRKPPGKIGQIGRTVF